MVKGRRFEDSEDFEEIFEEIRGDREVVQSIRAEQPAFRSWLLFCLSEVRSIAPSNAESEEQKRGEELRTKISHAVVVKLGEIEAKEGRSKSFRCVTGNRSGQMTVVWESQRQKFPANEKGRSSGPRHVGGIFAHTMIM